jgi:hypothetical protein
MQEVANPCGRAWLTPGNKDTKKEQGKARKRAPMAPSVGADTQKERPEPLLLRQMPTFYLSN